MCCQVYRAPIHCIPNQLSNSCTSNLLLELFAQEYWATFMYLISTPMQTNWQPGQGGLTGAAYHPLQHQMYPQNLVLPVQLPPKDGKPMLMQAHCRWKMHKPTSGALLPYQMHTFYGTSNLEPICLQCKLREPRATIDTTTCLSTIRCK